MTSTTDTKQPAATRTPRTPKAPAIPADETPTEVFPTGLGITPLPDVDLPAAQARPALQSIAITLKEIRDNWSQLTPQQQREGRDLLDSYTPLKDAVNEGKTVKRDDLVNLATKTQEYLDAGLRAVLEISMDYTDYRVFDLGQQVAVNLANLAHNTGQEFNRVHTRIDNVQEQVSFIKKIQNGITKTALIVSAVVGGLGGLLWFFQIGPARSESGAPLVINTVLASLLVFGLGLVVSALFSRKQKEVETQAAHSAHAEHVTTSTLMLPASPDTTKAVGANAGGQNKE